MHTPDEDPTPDADLRAVGLAPRTSISVKVVSVLLLGAAILAGLAIALPTAGERDATIAGTESLDKARD